jgi:Protein of unknown function (DUF3619)
VNPPNQTPPSGRSRSLSPTERENLRARFALRVAATLSERSDNCGHDISERLRIARERAVETARTGRIASTAPATSVVSGQRGTLVLGQRPGWLFRLAAALPVVVLVAGLVVIDQMHDERQSVAAAEVDTALLADDLPPDAYADAGFAQFLKSGGGQ